jgi:hypothetical protein
MAPPSMCCRTFSSIWFAKALFSFFCRATTMGKRKQVVHHQNWGGMSAARQLDGWCDKQQLSVSPMASIITRV